MEAARDEGENPGRFLVEPVRIVNNAQQRPRRSRAGQQVQRRQPDQEAVRRAAPAHAERGRQRLTQRCRKRLEASQVRDEKLVQRREAELRLRFDPDKANDVEIPG